MQFATAQELADHLAQTIDDEAFIAKAVRLKFPAWKGGEPRKDFTPKTPTPAPRMTTDAAYISERKSKDSYAVRAYGTTFDQDNGWFSSELNDRAVHSMLTNGSQNLLRALHDAHGGILERLKAQGRTVVQP